jgi:hypothetical protein
MSGNPQASFQNLNALLNDGQNIPFPLVRAEPDSNRGL